MQKYYFFVSFTNHNFEKKHAVIILLSQLAIYQTIDIIISMY